MRLDSLTSPLGRGKYALIKLRELTQLRDVTTSAQITAALALLAEEGILDYGEGLDGFFVLKLRDCFASPALEKYADAIRHHDAEFANDVWDLAAKSFNHPERGYPD